MGVLAFVSVAKSFRYPTVILELTIKGLLTPLHIIRSPLKTANDAKVVADQPSGEPAKLFAQVSDHISETLPVASIFTIFPLAPTAIICPL